VLLEDNPIAYYWMGFLIADGHFYEKGAIKLHLSEIDRDHINKFRKFVCYTGKAKSCTMNAMNPPVVEMIVNKFGISNRKTYNPVPIEKISNYDLLFSLFVGMLDGDGNIRNRNGTVSTFEMKLHGNWLSKLQLMESFIYKYLDVQRNKDTPLARLRKDGYSLILLTDRQLLAEMKKKVILFSLPVMGRKWDMIDENYVSREEKYLKINNEVYSLFDNGLSAKKVAEKLNKPLACIKWIRHKWLNAS
jgi:hypothetical protein